jgi:hypothetical protein
MKFRRPKQDGLTGGSVHGISDHPARHCRNRRTIYPDWCSDDFIPVVFTTGITFATNELTKTSNYRSFSTLDEAADLLLSTRLPRLM